MMNYLDDYIGVATSDKAECHYPSLLNLLRQMGLPVNEKKVEPPGMKVTCLGIFIDIETGVIAILNPKMLEIKKLCKGWLSKRFASKNQIQSLIGKLIYLHRCSSFYRDVKWFDNF